MIIIMVVVVMDAHLLAGPVDYLVMATFFQLCIIMHLHYDFVGWPSTFSVLKRKWRLAYHALPWYSSSKRVFCWLNGLFSSWYWTGGRSVKNLTNLDWMLLWTFSPICWGWNEKRKVRLWDSSPSWWLDYCTSLLRMGFIFKNYLLYWNKMLPLWYL